MADAKHWRRVLAFVCDSFDGISLPIARVMADYLRDHPATTPDELREQIERWRVVSDADAPSPPRSSGGASCSPHHRQRGDPVKALETAPTMDLPDTRVAVAGDWHGNLRWIGRAIPAAARAAASTLIHLGDFGIWPGQTAQLLGVVDFWCAKSTTPRQPGIRTVLVVPGNHEDWGELDRLLAEHPGQAIRVSEAVWILPRGYRLTISNRSVLAFGGAPSIDFLSRAEGYTWWRSELPTLADVEAAIAPGRADALLSHDVGQLVTPKVASIITGPDPWWTQTELDYANSGRAYIQWVIDGTTPLLHLHGHYHVRDSAIFDRDRQPPLRVESLDRDGHPGNVAILNAKTLRVTDLKV